MGVFEVQQKKVLTSFVWCDSVRPLVHVFSNCDVSGAIISARLFFESGKATGLIDSERQLSALRETITQGTIPVDNITLQNDSLLVAEVRIKDQGKEEKCLYSAFE